MLPWPCDVDEAGQIEKEEIYFYNILGNFGTEPLLIFKIELSLKIMHSCTFLFDLIYLLVCYDYFGIMLGSMLNLKAGDHNVEPNCCISLSY